jgi:glutathione S-transferase
LITLYTFGPFFGLPDASPFVMKGMLLLKMAGLPFVEDRNGYMKAPKGKLPYIDDDGQKIADTAFIRLHIEKKYGYDYDAGLTAEQQAIAYALEKLCEDHLYWLVIADRWLIDANFARGPAQFFDAAPAPLRPLIGASSGARFAGTRRARAFTVILSTSAANWRDAALRRSPRCSATSLFCSAMRRMESTRRWALSPSPALAPTSKAPPATRRKNFPISPLTPGGSKRPGFRSKHKKGRPEWSGLNVRAKELAD